MTESTGTAVTAPRTAYGTGLATVTANGTLLRRLVSRPRPCSTPAGRPDAENDLAADAADSADADRGTHA